MLTTSTNENIVRSRITFIQEQLTEYSACSVMGVALQALATYKPWTFEDVQAMPGLTLLLVKWAIQNPNCRMYLGKNLTLERFDYFRQELWDLTGLAKAGNPNASAMVRSLLPIQIDFQRRSPWGFMRWPSLLTRYPTTHQSHIQFVQSIGVTPEQFIDACMILQAPIRTGKFEIDAQWLAQIPDVYQTPVARVLGAIGKDFLELRAVLTAAWSTYKPSSWELFESPFSKKYPLLRTPQNTWRAWHPAMFERGLEDAVHLILTPLGSQYTEVYSRVFESYVVELAEEVAPDLVAESRWKSAMGHNAPSVEAIIPVEQVNVFIEAKMSLFHDDVLIEDSEYGLSRRLERVISALKQGWNVSKLLRDRPKSLPTLTMATEEYLIIVTSRELHLGGGLALERVVPKGCLTPPDEATTNRLPLENVFVLSIEAFEHLQQAIIQQKVGLLEVLRAAKAANRDPGTAAMYFDDHLKKYTKQWDLPKVMQTAQDDSMTRLKNAFS